MSALLWTFISVGVVSLLSLAGALGLSFGMLRRHRVMMALIALAAGTLLGDAFLHLLPEAAGDGFTTSIGLWALGGFLVMFGIEVVLRRGHSHGEHMGGDHDHDHGHIEPFGWLNLVGDALHNLLDGVIIAAAFTIDTSAGIATTVAVALHEIPQELGDFAVLVRSGMPVKKALALNFGSALFAVIGAGAVFAFGFDGTTLGVVALPLIAGAFVYIAAADLVPELHHHKGRDMTVIIVALVVGLLLMYALLGLEAILPGA
jgi:zinc and cadmium transporter